MKTTLGLKYHFSAEINTPVHIGSDDGLFPFIDYAMNEKNNAVHILDATQLMTEVMKTGETDYELFINSVFEKREQNRKNMKPAKGVAVEVTDEDQVKADFICNFLHTHNIQLKDIAVLRTIAAYGISNPRQISCCLKTGGKPFIPGSSLKGAIRTALLFNWLENDNKGKGTLKMWLDGLKPSDRQPEKVIYKFGDLERVFFGNPNFRLPMSLFAISDSEAFHREQALAVYNVGRFNLRVGKVNEKFAFPKECIHTGEKTEFEVSITMDNEVEKFHPFFKALQKPNDFCRIVNSHSLSLLHHEMEMLGMVGVAKTNFAEYENNLKKCIEIAEKNMNTGKFLIRLGAGKIQFYQTVGMAVYNYCSKDTSSPEWQNYLYHLQAKKNKEGKYPDPFPSTRALTVSGQVPLGWIELTIK